MGIQDRLPPGTMTRAQLAKAVDRSLVVIRKMEDAGDLVPEVKFYGKTPVRLYRIADVPKIKRVIAKRKPGRPSSTSSSPSSEPASRHRS